MNATNITGSKLLAFSACKALVCSERLTALELALYFLLSKVDYSDLDSADFQSSKFIAKLSKDVATSALLNKLVLEVNSRGRSFEVNQSAIDVSAIF